METSLILHSVYELLKFSKAHWKFYHWNARNIQDRYKFPFVDIFFYQANSSHIYFPFIWPRQQIFPLIKRPFESLMLNAPRNTVYFLESEYSDDYKSCSFSGGDHVNFGWRETCSVDCSALFGDFPFVFRENKTYHYTAIENQENTLPNNLHYIKLQQEWEILKLGNKEINRHLIKIPIFEI